MATTKLKLHEPVRLLLVETYGSDWQKTITKHWQKDPSFAGQLANRIEAVMPGYLISIAVTNGLLIVGSTVTNFPGSRHRRPAR